MRRAVRLLPWALLCCAVAALAVAGALWLAVEPVPRVPTAPAVSHQDIARARALVSRNDPRRALPGINRNEVLLQRDLDLLLNHAAQRLGGGRARARLVAGLAVVEASLPLPANPWGGWLNLQAVLHETTGLPEVQRLRLGALPVPAWLAEAAVPPLLAALGLGPTGTLAHQLVSQVAFRPQHLVVAYAWPDNPGQVITDSLLSAEDQARLRVYDQHLAALLGRLVPPGSGRQVSLMDLLQPMFSLARSRSTDAASATGENRAALMALAFMAHGNRLAPLVGGPPAAPPAGAIGRPGWPAAHAARRRAGAPVTLAGRIDFPQHVLISAALAAEGGGPLADAIGLYKEVADAQTGSGFSFRDLAADRAGSRLGLRARRDPLGLQHALADGAPETALLPDLADLPEYLSMAEFRRRYGAVGAPAYRALQAEIEARLDRLPLLRSARPAG